MAIAREDANAILRTVYDGIPVLSVDAVAGSGKTRTVERLAVLSAAEFGERCMIVSSTNEQAIDIARRLGRWWPDYPVTLFVREDLPLPLDVLNLSSVAVAMRTGDLPTGRPAIVVANADRWSWSALDRSRPHFDRQLVDEAYQVLDAKWVQVSGLASSHILIGDPAQIAPIVNVDVIRWAASSSSPHVAAPRALLARDPTVPRLTLRVTHRLSAETATIVGPSFYPSIPMISIARPGSRRLITAIAGLAPLDRLIDLSGDSGIVLGQLPPAATGEYDNGMISTITLLVRRLLARSPTVIDETGQRPLTPERIGIITPHVSQVTAIQARLPGVRVETANRWQGLETDVAVVWHPLSGRADVGGFHLDAGRLCVSLSRHRIACMVMTRAGLPELLESHVPSGARVPGMDDDPEYAGWQAHRQLLRRVQDRGAVMALPTP
jgi:hypothetical protein